MYLPRLILVIYFSIIITVPILNYFFQKTTRILLYYHVGTIVASLQAELANIIFIYDIK